MRKINIAGAQQATTEARSRERERFLKQEFKENKKNSPNSSRTLKPEGIILHHSAGSYPGTVSWILNPQSKVSYHCVVSESGERTILVPDNVQAWHAGVSSFNGKNSCNSFMLGISVSGNTNTRELTDNEALSVAQWCVRKMKAYNFGIDQITTHRHVSPNRKNDVDVRAEKKIKEMIAELLR
jgi:N-acetyl-anhydromuramyl-L-alanine amidase AmpD